MIFTQLLKVARRKRGLPLASKSQLSRLRLMSHRALIASLLLIHLGLGAPLVRGQLLKEDVYATEQGIAVIANNHVGTPPGVLDNDQFQGGGAWVTEPPKHGELIFQEDGTFSYQPHPNFVGTDTFRYAVETGEPIRPLNNLSWRALFPPNSSPPGLTFPGFDQNWTKLGFDDSAWTPDAKGLIGYGVFGEGTGMEEPLDTEFSISGFDRNTGYLRSKFIVEASGRYRLRMRFFRDDGAILYLDGEEIMRSFEPGVRAAKSAPDDFHLSVGSDIWVWTSNYTEVTRHSLEIDGLRLMAGEHCLAVSIHDTFGASSDLGFKLEQFELVPMEETKVDIRFSVGNRKPVGEPDWFAVRSGEKLDTSLSDQSLYRNDGLLDGAGKPFREIVDLVIEDPMNSGLISNIDPASGNFQFIPRAEFAGVAKLSYIVSTSEGESAPVPFFIWVNQSFGPDSFQPEVVIGDRDTSTKVAIPIPTEALIVQVEQPESARVFGSTLPSSKALVVSWRKQEDLAPPKTEHIFVDATIDGTAVQIPIELKLTSPMTIWRRENFDESQLADLSISGALADPDQDGYVNLIEYAFKKKPLNPKNRPWLQLRPKENGYLSTPRVSRTSQLDTGLPNDVIIELQASASPLGRQWEPIKVYYGGVVDRWIGEFPVHEHHPAAIYRYRVSLYPWVTDVPE